MRFFAAVLTAAVLLAACALVGLFWLPMPAAIGVAFTYCALALLCGIAVVVWIFVTGGPR
ncbi:hypothetical protein [Microbacterium sp. AR7-10]|uniref:hypothetical protein n=1 Tax=Microbacterium sp. AR7-10 TaxID=1891970 RepID=UPI0008FC9039|nr:hypothetical protein [Microbacterium sp. AR7-10]OIU88669.1 hypothetical protein BFN01_04290 [Microbacterium sp. AR7-10]